jgi:hypothetical protein
MIYGWFGKAALRFGLRYALRRYQRPAGIATVAALVAATGAAAYWLRREVPEG